MSIALLVLASRYPLGLRALTRLFNTPEFDIFVHVDNKLDQAPFLKEAGGRATFLAERIEVYWRGWTMIEATMRLLDRARSIKRYESYVLISDDSLPLLSVAELKIALSENSNHMHVHPADDRAWRYEKYFMFDSHATQLRWTQDREVTPDASNRLKRLADRRQGGKKPIARHFQGSQWWALSDDSVQEIFRSWNEDAWLRESFEFSDAPDEGYFQHILSGRVPSRALMYVDWETPPSISPPRVFKTAADIAEIKPSTHLFVRKVDFDPDELDKWVLHLGS
jgi:Core-2/I-Branching enzyme